MPKGYIIAHITVRDPDAYKEYVEKDTPILAGMGARFVVRGGRSSQVEGELHERHVVIEFPSYEEALAAYHDPESRRFVVARRRAASWSSRATTHDCN